MKTTLLTTWISLFIVATAPSAMSLATVLTRSSLPTPAAVKATIARLYPTAKNVKYNRENADFEATFNQNGKSMSVVLDAKGVLKETETTIAISELPAAIRAYVSKQLPGKKIKEAAEIISAKGVKTFEAEVDGKDLLFDTTGKLIH